MSLRILSQMVPLFVARARASNPDVAELLHAFSLPADVDARREIEVPLRVLQELPEAIAQRTGDVCLGLSVAMSSPRGLYGLTEFSARSAPTLGEACKRFAHYVRLIDSVTTNSFEIRDSEAHFTMRIAGEPACFGRHGNELVVAFLIRVLAEAVAPAAWAPQRVWLAHREPSELSRLVAAFGTQEIELGTGSNGFSLRTSELRLGLSAADPALMTVLDEYAHRSLAAEPAQAGPSTLDARLREQIQLALRRGTPRLEQIAAELGTGPRTLQRRLAEYGLTFNDVVDEVRQERARVYLADDELVLGEIAYLLGFSDLRAFGRAFKRWTGITPSKYREKIRGVT